MLPSAPHQKHRIDLHNRHPEISHMWRWLSPDIRWCGGAGIYPSMIMKMPRVEKRCIRRNLSLLPKRIASTTSCYFSMQLDGEWRPLLDDGGWHFNCHCHHSLRLHWCWELVFFCCFGWFCSSVSAAAAVARCLFHARADGFPLLVCPTLPSMSPAKTHRTINRHPGAATCKEVSVSRQISMPRVSRAS
jgi:hypothetical protein